MIEVCICTHGGDPATFQLVTEALARQTLSKRKFRITVVDNANTPPLSLKRAPLNVLVAAGIETRILREPKLGVAHARIRAIRGTDGPSIVFVDDDNVLADDFLEQAAKVLATRPGVGCFSGTIRLPSHLRVPQWLSPLLGNYAVRELGPNSIEQWFTGGEWEPWIPAATASMVVRREVTDIFLRKHASRKDYVQFGRKGRELLSGEDYLIALSAADANMKCGYFPKLLMEHWVHPKRFKMLYVMRLMSGFGKSDVLRDEYLGTPPVTFPATELFSRLIAESHKGDGLRVRLCALAYQYSYIKLRAGRLFDAGMPVCEETPSNG